MKSIKLTKQEFALVAIHQQLEIAGVDKSVLHEDKEWFSNNTMSSEQHQHWKQWFIQQYRLNFKSSKKEAEREFSWFDLGYGLRVKELDQIQ